MRSPAGNVDQFLFRSSRMRCSLARQVFILSSGVWSDPRIEPAARQLAVRSQLGTPSPTAARVRRAEASVGQNEMPSAEAAARARMKAAGAFNGLPRPKLRNTMQAI